jgi:glycosyltransferase involved in cell wall biosynthesis
MASGVPIVRRIVETGIGFTERLAKTDHAVTIEAALAAVIKEWKPDIIHTLGFDSASYFYLRARKEFKLETIGRWIAQARGGPDLALQRYSPAYRPLIEEVLATCDHFIADNVPNYSYALSAGLKEEKVSNPGMGVVSGAGGIDVEAMRRMWSLLPSKRERVIVWPKAYELYTSKAMPVFEAILNVWDRIQPCRIEMLWMVQSDVQIWYEKLFPPHIKAHCPSYGRLSREETLQRVASARVMIAPSLSDGIPNTMMEAMALGAAPLVSPLDTITPVVRHEENVLFARNLYPDELGDALVRLMSDDDLVDRMAENNLVRIQELADRRAVKRRALVYYDEIARQAQRISQQSEI